MHGRSHKIAILSFPASKNRKRKPFLQQIFRIMRFPSLLWVVLVCLLAASCKKEAPRQPVAAEIFLKSIAFQSLPAPYYQFEYSGPARVSKVTTDGGDVLYQAIYDGRRLLELVQQQARQAKSILYSYGSSNQVESLRFLSAGGEVERRCFLRYDAQGRLDEMEWEVKAGASFAADRTIQFAYNEKHNVTERREQCHFIDGRQEAATLIDTFEDYDDQLNIDGFTLLQRHNGPFVLLPGVVLQRNNPRRVTRTGTGIHYQIDYTYTYTKKRCPLERKSTMVINNGPQAGQRTEATTAFAYYD
jgi:hypothetical protein